MTYRIADLILASAAILNTLPVPGFATEPLPIRKPGRWQLTTVSEIIGMKTFETCIAATDNIITGDGRKNCSDVDVKKIANETFVNVTCKDGDNTQKISTLLTGDFTTWYRALTKITFDRPQNGVSHLGVIVDGKYLGSNCSANTRDTR
jgi:hypothetical protein